MVETLSGAPCASAASIRRPQAAAGSGAAPRIAAMPASGTQRVRPSEQSRSRSPVAERDLAEGGLDPVERADGAGDHVRLRVGRGVGGVELAAIDQLLHQRVVAGQLLERRRRGRDSRGCRRPSRGSRGRPRSARATTVAPIGPSPSARARRRTSAWAAAKASCSERAPAAAVRQPGEGVDDEVGGEVAVPVPAHAVGHRPERAGRVGQDGVLVALAHVAAVAGPGPGGDQAAGARRRQAGAGARHRRAPGVTGVASITRTSHLASSRERLPKRCVQVDDTIQLRGAEHDRMGARQLEATYRMDRRGGGRLGRASPAPRS